MALEIALAAIPQCRSGTPVSRRIRSGFHVGQVASWMAIQLLTTAVIQHSCSDMMDQPMIRSMIDRPLRPIGPMGKPKCLSGTSERGQYDQPAIGLQPRRMEWIPQVKRTE